MRLAGLDQRWKGTHTMSCRVPSGESRDQEWWDGMGSSYMDWVSSHEGPGQAVSAAQGDSGRVGVCGGGSQVQ